MNYYSVYTYHPLPWIEKMPAHWKLVRGKNLYKKMQRPVQDQDEVVTCFRDGTVTLRKNRRTTGFTESLLEIGYQGIRKGDLVIHVMDAFAGSIGVSALLLREMARTGFIQSLYRGIRERSSDFRFEVFASQFYPVPPREEQDQIVRFLDWKVSSINKLISVRKRQIDEFEELKRSKIGHLVMGQSKDIPQRCTSISWMKTIPVHWEEKTLIQFADEQQIKNTGMVENNLLSLSYGKIVSKDINTMDGLLPASFEGYQIVQNGNIVLRLTDLQNDHKSLRTGLATQTGIITSAYTCLKVREGMLPEYLQLQLHVADLCKVFYGIGGGVRQSIGFKDIRGLLIAIPTVEEQHHILELVHGVEEPINNAIRKNKDIIVSLEELKKRLISDIVTGKKDVRDIKIPDCESMDE